MKTLLATISQSLGALLKSARDIMRKDKGLNGDLDRLPLLTWIMFLKFLDNLEIPRPDGTHAARVCLPKRNKGLKSDSDDCRWSW